MIVLRPKLVAVLWLAALLAGPARAPAETPLAQRLDTAIAAAAAYLKSTIGPSGKCAGEYPQADERFGAKTALCVYALLTLEPVAGDPSVERAIDWLSKAELDGTYAVAMRAHAMAALPQNRAVPVLQRDVRWLLAAADTEGGYSDKSLHNQRGERIDNLHTELAILGVAAAAERGVEVPPAYWRSVGRHLLDHQQDDGGWAYRVRPPVMSAKTYGSLTAGGLTALYACLERLGERELRGGTGLERYEPIDKAVDWLGRNFAVAENPRLGFNWYYQWLYLLERAGWASGRKYFGGHDWYRQGVSALLARQHDDGRWGYGESVEQTALGLLFLCRGRRPVLVNKLAHLGQWNLRPRDAANLTRWLGRTFEEPMRWQIVGVDSPISDWHDAQILYISGAGPARFDDGQIDKLRRYVHQGGLIVSEAASNSATFTLSMQQVYRRLFAERRLVQLGSDHAVYSVQFSLDDAPVIWGLSNGIRLLAVHSPRELSRSLQLGPGGKRTGEFQLLANIYLYATDRGAHRPWGDRAWPEPKPHAPTRTIRVARIRYDGNFDPEPLALARLAIHMLNRHGIGLAISQPLPIERLDRTDWPVAVMTGTAGFTLSDEQLFALRTYLRAGGTLIVDAAGGAPGFADAVERQLLELLASGQLRPVTLEQLRVGPERIEQVRYRRDFATALGPAVDRPRIQAVYLADRPAIFYSREDITAALVGYPGYRLRGYGPETARAIMCNLLIQASGEIAR